MANVLVVEDEADLRDILSYNLVQAGHRVELAATGDEGLRIAKTVAIDVVLLDLMLPDMPGTELAARLHVSHPNLRVIVMSGYVEDIAMHHDVRAAGARFLNKPFSRDELLDTIRSVFEEPRLEAT